MVDKENPLGLKIAVGLYLLLTGLTSFFLFLLLAEGENISGIRWLFELGIPSLLVSSLIVAIFLWKGSSLARNIVIVELLLIPVFLLFLGSWLFALISFILSVLIVYLLWFEKSVSIQFSEGSREKEMQEEGTAQQEERISSPSQLMLRAYNVFQLGVGLIILVFAMIFLTGSLDTPMVLLFISIALIAVYLVWKKIYR